MAVQLGGQLGRPIPRAIRAEVGNEARQGVRRPEEFQAKAAVGEFARVDRHRLDMDLPLAEIQHFSTLNALRRIEGIDPGGPPRVYLIGHVFQRLTKNRAIDGGG